MSTKMANVLTSLPGPKAKELLERRNKIVPDAVSFGIPTFVESAKGAILRDVDGNRFIDFAGAIGTINAGHCPPAVVEALHKQIDQYIHTGFNVMMYEPYVEFAEKLAALAPGDSPRKVMFLNSGAEAVENAIKIARRYTKRQAIISFSQGFHGRTLLTMSLTGRLRPYKTGFGPFAPEVYRAPFPNYYRRPEQMSEEEYTHHMLKEIKKFFEQEVATETIAAVIMEPVQGEAGFIVPSPTFVQGVYDLCKKHDILFIADEIQAGFGRTGRYFASEHFGIVPDLITISKSMGAGLPISGVIGHQEIMDTAGPGELGGTYCGSPLGCVAGIAVLETMEKENLNQRAEQIGEKLMATFKEWYDKYDVIGDIRGLGAMCALEFVQDRESKEPHPALTNLIVTEAGKRGLIVLKAGEYNNVIRMLMPLVITDEELSEGLSILEESIAFAQSSLS